MKTASVNGIPSADAWPAENDDPQGRDGLRDGPEPDGRDDGGREPPKTATAVEEAPDPFDFIGMVLVGLGIGGLAFGLTILGLDFLPVSLVVALILAFIFLTPREWFRDQPRASSVIMLPSEKGVTRLWIEPDLLAGLKEDQRLEQARQLLNSRTGKHGKLTRLETIYDSEQDIRGFLAYATE